jgi:diguanylate cyclase (GGDEF)-like protein
MQSTDNAVTSIVTRVALAVALVVTLAPPLGYWITAYKDFGGGLEFKAKVKATALSDLIATSPELWMYAENRLQGLLVREAFPLDTELVRVYDVGGNLLAEAGNIPVSPVMRRSYLLHDSMRLVGRIEVSESLRGILVGTAIAAALGILLGGLVFIALRTFPLRALRRVAEDLSANHAKLFQSNILLQQEVRQTQLATERAEYLAYYDALTGLANRNLFHERLVQYVESAKSDGQKLAVLVVDVERFKNINDTFGRQAGDELLKQVAVRIERYAGPIRMARLNVDNFAIVRSDVSSESEVARLIEQWLADCFGPPYVVSGTELRVSAKAGIALFPNDGADADALFRNAETALKKAKASGERYLFHTQQMTETVAGKVTLENQLRQALDNEEFVLHYQPKVSLESGKLTGAEALIRWNDPRTGLVPPGRFIPVLEETGLIFEAGRWALRRAIQDYLRWRAAGLAAVRIAVNVSPLQLRNRGFIEEIKQVISVDAHAPAGLELEITESLIMQDIKHNIASLQAIRAMGVTIAIDDFGTGFSSLSYLAKLPVDALKIDRSFVVDMTSGPQGLALVSTIINLAHSLKLKVVAEGVETEEQSRLLRLLSCDEMQGFLFSKPVPGEIFETRFLAPTRAGSRAMV